MPLRIYRRGKWWHYRGSIAGRELRGPAKTQDKATAERVAAEIEQRFWQSRFDGPKAVLTFAQAAILYRQAEKSARFLDRIEDYWRDRLVKEITPGAIRQSALALYPNHSGATRNRQVIVPTQAIINHAAELELCQRISVKRFPVEKKERKPINAEWIAAFRQHANPHLGALALFMFTTGARIGEALAVRWPDIDFQSRMVLIKQTKIGEERSAPLIDELIVSLANIQPQGRTVFKYSSRSTAKVQWNKAASRAGIDRLSFHCCRHGFATTMLQAGVDPVTVAKFGGWKSTAHLWATYGHARDDNGVIADVFSTIGKKGSSRIQ